MAPRLDNVGIVVADLAAAIAFFTELGLELEGRATVEGEWAGRVTGLGDQRVEIAMMRTPDGHGRLELSRFLEPQVIADHRDAPVNALGYLRVMFEVDDLDETLVRLGRHGAQLVGSEVVQYGDAYRLCYVRGPEGILLGLAQSLADPEPELELPDGGTAVAAAEAVATLILGASADGDVLSDVIAWKHVDDGGDLLGGDVRPAVVDREEGDVGGVVAGGDPDEGFPWAEGGRVRHVPAAVDVGLGHGMEVHRLDPWRVHPDHARRDVQGPEEGDHEMGEVAADSPA